MKSRLQRVTFPTKFVDRYFDIHINCKSEVYEDCVSSRVWCGRGGCRFTWFTINHRTCLILSKIFCVAKINKHQSKAEGEIWPIRWKGKDEWGRTTSEAGRGCTLLKPREKYIVINLSSKLFSRIHPVKEINLAAKAKDVGFTPHKKTDCIILVGTRNVDGWRYGIQTTKRGALYYFGWHAKRVRVFPRWERKQYL